MAKYGKTFWGREWLNALNDIDYGNRLPRGSAYASRGAVRSMDIKGGTIHARVQGSRPKPYDISITVPAFSPAQKKRLSNILSGNAGWLAALLNRQLPEELLARAKTARIALFPGTWSDLAMQCSCPDWAVPCKHLAAVIYLIANDIDLNPMRVLELHGFDVVSELGQRDINVSSQVNADVPDLNETLRPYSFTLLEAQETNVPSIDFSLFPAINESFITLLSLQPPFFEKDFKEALLTHFRFVRKNVRKQVLLHSRALDASLALHTCVDTRLVLDSALATPQILVCHEHGERRVELSEWLRYAPALNADQIAGWCFPLRLLHMYTVLAVHLLSCGAVVPRLVRIGDEHRVEWTALGKNDVVRGMLEQLHAVCPEAILLVEDAGGKQRVFLQSFASERLLTTIITVLVHQTLECERRITAEDAVTQLFFRAPRSPSTALAASVSIQAPRKKDQSRGERFASHRGYFFPFKVSRTDHVAQRKADSLALASQRPSADFFRSIALWLKKLHLTGRDLIPVLQIHEDFPVFSLSLLIADRSTKTMQAPLPLHTFKKEKRYADRQMQVLQDVMLLAEHFPDLSGIVNSAAARTVSYDSERFAVVLLEMLPVLQMLGMEALLPASLKHVVRPRPTLKLAAKGAGKAKTWLDLSAMLDFQWHVAVGDAHMDADAFLRLVSGMSGIVKLRDGFIHLTDSDLAKLVKQLNEPPDLTGQAAIRALFSREYDGAPIALSAELARLLDAWTSVQTVPLPKGLQATLRPYQRRGYEWLYKNTRIGFGSILADDMGLGKTVQTIALLLKMREEKKASEQNKRPLRALIVVPTSLLTNWSNELDRFAPSLSYATYHGLARDDTDLGCTDILLTSYGTARRDHGALAKMEWEALIVDEAQNIKNPAADQTKSIKSIPARFRIALSGTPVENRLSEYWSIADFTNKGFLGSQADFAKSFATPIQTEHNQSRIAAFRTLTAPFILRRLKTDKTVISDLPDKVENNVVCSLVLEQAALYERVVKHIMQSVERSEGIERKGLVLKLMTALKQVCNHPAQYLKEGKQDAGGSGKLALLFELLAPILDRNEKTLIFTQYKEMGELLARFLRDKFHEEPLFFHGSLSRTARDEMVHAFQNFPHHRLFILSLKAGGTGLNLTAAHNVIHYDLWWNPAVEAQATDRAYRIGQRKNVMVYRLISRGTLEEKIDAMIASKKELADLTVATGEKWLGELNNAELKELVSLSGSVGG